MRMHVPYLIALRVGVGVGVGLSVAASAADKRQWLELLPAHAAYQRARDRRRNSMSTVGPEPLAASKVRAASLAGGDFSVHDGAQDRDSLFRTTVSAASSADETARGRHEGLLELGRDAVEDVDGAGEGEAQRGVDHVGRRQPVVDPRARGHADPLLDHVDERRDVVVGDALALAHREALALALIETSERSVVGERSERRADDGIAGLDQ